jgi:hypothetical protein
MQVQLNEFSSNFNSNWEWEENTDSPSQSDDMHMYVKNEKHELCVYAWVLAPLLLARILTSSLSAASVHASSARPLFLLSLFE